MKKIKYVVLATSLFFTALTSCKKENVSPDSNVTTMNGRQAQPGTNLTVQITNGSFNPRSLDAPAGSTVTWINDDASVQTVTADDESFNSGDIQPGQSYSMTVSAVGQHAYHSNYNSGLIGMLNVTGIK